MKRTTIISLLPFLLLVGCASGGVNLPDNTLVLGEVRHVLTHEHVNAGSLGPNVEVKNLNQLIHDWGFTDQQIENGRVYVVREGFYWNNVVSGIKREMLRPVLVPEGLNVDQGNVLEGAVGIPFTAVRIRAKDLDEGKCYYDELPTGLAKGLMGVVSKVGPSGAATLYCVGVENEGWQRPRSFWHKLPTGPSAPK